MLYSIQGILFNSEIRYLGEGENQRMLRVNWVLLNNNPACAYEYRTASTGITHNLRETLRAIGMIDEGYRH